MGALAGTGLADGWWFAANDNAWPYDARRPSPVLAAVGDISCQPGQPAGVREADRHLRSGLGSTVRDAAQNATAEQVEAMKPGLVAVLGDEQYQNGYYSDFENSFDKYWGAFKFLQRPRPATTSSTTTMARRASAAWAISTTTTASSTPPTARRSTTR